MKKHIGNAFTIVELMIVIAIMWLMLTFVYLPYAHYQEKIKIKQVVREVSQWLSEARNMAINGFDEWIEGWSFENKSIGLYLDSSEDKKNKMYFISYPHDIDEIKINPEENPTDNITFIGSGRPFPAGIEFDGGKWINNFESVLFFFESISADDSYYGFPGRNLIGSDIIELNFSFKDSTSPILQKTIKYDTRVNISHF